MEEGLSIYTVYNSPSDYPGRFVVRRFVVDGAGGHAREIVAIGDSLEAVRETLLGLAGPLYRLDRSARDDVNIVESWL